MRKSLGGPSRPESSFTLFKQMLNISGLHEVKMIGGKFTWVGQMHKYTVRTKIDIVMANAEWQDMFPKAHVKLLNYIGSYHMPLFSYTEDRKWRGTKLFRYDSKWRFNLEADKEVPKTWNMECE